MMNSIPRNNIVGIEGRDAFFDTLKSFLILFVVIDHSFGLFREDRIVMSVLQMNLIFTMPLFICVSGYFTHHSDSRKFFKAIANLFILFLVNHILRIAYGAFVNGEFSFERLWWSYFGLWFLPVMMTYRVIYQYFHKIIERGAVAIFVVSFVISLLWGFVNTNPMTIGQRIVNFFPYFTMGIIARQYGLFDKAKKIPLYCGCIFFVLAFATLYTVNNGEVRRLLWLELPYSCIDFSSSMQVVAKIVQLGASVVLGACLVGIVNNLKFSLHIDTLFVYIWHLWILKPFAKWIVAHFDVPQNLFSAIVCVLLTLCVLSLLSHVKWTKTILKPIK